MFAMISSKFGNVDKSLKKWIRRNQNADALKEEFVSYPSTHFSGWLDFFFSVWAKNVLIIIVVQIITYPLGFMFLRFEIYSKPMILHKMPTNQQTNWNQTRGHDTPSQAPGDLWIDEMWFGQVLQEFFFLLFIFLVIESFKVDEFSFQLVVDHANYQPNDGKQGGQPIIISPLTVYFVIHFVSILLCYRWKQPASSSCEPSLFSYRQQLWVFNGDLIWLFVVWVCARLFWFIYGLMVLFH